MNQRLEIAAKVKSLIGGALATLEAPPAEGSTGFFSATLTWDGSGDVDTHVYEPDGTHVWYQAPTGNAGYLDVDNTVADGPEHYYSSCSSEKLQTGSYVVEVANFAEATGRVATIQIASFSDGVLGTKSVTLGGPTANVPSVTLFTVIVTKDATTGRYEVAIGP